MENKLYHSPRHDLLANTNGKYETIEKIANFFKISTGRVKRNRTRKTTLGVSIMDRLYDHHKLCDIAKDNKQYEEQLNRNIDKLAKDEKLAGLIYEYLDVRNGKTFTISVKR